MDHFSTDSSRWHATQKRNPQAANAFVYCVKTTRIACRPNCVARLARRSNVIFHDSFAVAQAAGFRACKRCKPEIKIYDPQADIIARACKTIQERAAAVPVNELATTAGLTKSHFHRVFKKVTHMTPRNYSINSKAENLTSTPSLMSVGSFSQTTPSRRESEDVLTPTTPYAEDEDVGGEFKNANPLAMEEPFEAPRMLSPSDRDEAEASVAARGKDIDYTIQPWASGFVIIAVTEDGICWLEAGFSVTELSQSLRNEFPHSEIQASAWPGGLTNRGVDSNKYAMFSEVMEALVNPTGKILDLSFDIS